MKPSPLKYLLCGMTCKRGLAKWISNTEHLNTGFRMCWLIHLGRDY
jgi:hypothetical protein